MGAPIPKQHKHVVVAQKASILKKKGKKNTTLITQKYRVEQFLKGFYALGDCKYWQPQVDCKRVNKGTNSKIIIKVFF